MTEITILASHPINVFKESDLSSAMKDSLRDGDPAEQIIEGLAKSEVLVVDVAALWKNWGNLNRAFNDEQNLTCFGFCKIYSLSHARVGE